MKQDQEGIQKQTDMFKQTHENAVKYIFIMNKWNLKVY